MPSLVQTVLRNATRKSGEPINILTFPTHERYQWNISKTGQNFYLWQGEGIKPWRGDYAKVPQGTVLLNPENGSNQIPPEVDLDLVLSQNKFGQFEIAKQIASQLALPLVSIEHTLPMESWNEQQLIQLYNMKGDVNIFISDYSRKRWGWRDDEALVLHHGIDSVEFSPGENVKREKVALSVVNDWINRDWCCGFNLWRQITEYPESNFPVVVLGDTPGLSKSAKSTEELIETYRKSLVFLNTSLISPVPTSLLEAMSCGCAVVSTATCMIPEIIENGKNGYISNDPNELRKFVKKLLDDEELAIELGKNARQTIIDNFSLTDFVSNWNQIFYGVLNE
tara:strand:+ start:886 stop:1899 length:1014 start_codon:yes stop_codon:yes gene_type:complete